MYPFDTFNYGSFINSVCQQASKQANKTNVSYLTFCQFYFFFCIPFTNFPGNSWKKTKHVFLVNDDDDERPTTTTMMMMMMIDDNVAVMSPERNVFLPSGLLQE